MLGADPPQIVLHWGDKKKNISGFFSSPLCRGRMEQVKAAACSRAVWLPPGFPLFACVIQKVATLGKPLSFLFWWLLQPQQSRSHFHQLPNLAAMMEKAKDMNYVQVCKVLLKFWGCDTSWNSSGGLKHPFQWCNHRDTNQQNKAKKCPCVLSAFSSRS